MAVEKCLLLALFCTLLASAALAADEPQVYRYKDNKKVRVAGEEHVVLLVESPRGGHPGRLVVPNDGGKPKADQMSVVTGLSAGALIQATTQNEKGTQLMQSLATYSPKQGEETPNGFVFVESKPAKEGSKDTVVVLSKLGEKTIVSLPAEKEPNGDVQPEAKVVAETVQKLKQGDAVWADVVPGKQPTLAAIMPYEEPRTGKLLKVTPAEVDGHKGFEAQIDDSGKTIHALVPGRLHKDVWVSDQRLLSAARRFRAGTEIRFRVQEVADKTFLREIQPPPRQETAQNQNQTRNRDNGNVTDKRGLPNPRRTGGPVQLPPIGITPGGF